MSPSGSKSASSIPSGIESLVRQASISSKTKSPPSKGVREGEEVVMIGSEDGEYLEGFPTLNVMASSLTQRVNSSPEDGRVRVMEVRDLSKKFVQNKNDEGRIFVRCGDPNHLIGEHPKPPKDKNQRAFVGGSWSDSGEEDDEKVKDETCLTAQASNEVNGYPGLLTLQTSQTSFPTLLLIQADDPGCMNLIVMNLLAKIALMRIFLEWLADAPLRYKEEVKDWKEMQNVETVFQDHEQYAQIEPRESKPKLYDGNTILKMDTIVIPDSDETLMLCEESRSKMLLKEQDPLFEKHRVNTKPINYAILNNDYYKRFVRQSDLYSEHAYWKATSVPALDPSHSSTTVIVEVPKELPKVSMVNTSLKELKRYLTGFDQVVKERTTATAITEGTWGFEHTKACFRDEIIPFIKELKDIFNNFNQYLVEELADVQKVFYQMEQAVEQHRLESRTFEVKMNQVLSENERLLAQAIDHDIVKTVVNLSVNDGCETVNECQKCLELKTELLNKKDFVDKETYDKLCKSFTTLEKHCITLEADSQLNQEIFQQENSVLNQNAPSFTQLFELSELRAQSQAKDTVIVKLKEQIKSLKGNVDDSKVKMDMDEIETLNIELEHRVTKLVAENEHLKQTYKQLYDSIKPKRVQSKEQCDALIKQVNIKSGEISDLNAKLQEQGLVIAALKNELRKLKGKAVDKEAIETHSVDPNVSKDNMEPITPKLLNKRTAHSSYIKHTQEEALVLRDIVEHVKANYPQDSLLESAFRNDRIQQTPSSNSKNKVEAHPRNVKSSLNKRNGTVKVNGSASVQNSKKHDNSDYVCINGDDCMSSDNLCVSNSMNDVKFHAKPKRKSKKEIYMGNYLSHQNRGIFINQSKYALESLKKYSFDSCDPVDTLMMEKSKLDEDKEGKAVDPSHYRGMIDTDMCLITHIFYL
ncbi:hypothetical protein Tco_0816410 [Tanacetum coccineum]